MRIVSIDPGSSYMKIYDGQSATRVPAVVLGLTETTRSYCADPVTMDGRDYAVGHDALTLMSEPPATTNESRNLHGSRPQTVEICNALDVAAVPNGTYELLVRSVPYDQAKQREADLRRINTETTFTWRRGGEDRVVSFRDIRVVPQGVGAQEVYNRENHVLPPTMCILDIGSYTLDVVTTQYNAGSGQYSYHPASGSLRASDVSVNWFKQELQRRIAHQGIKRRFGYHELMELVEGLETSGKFEVFDAGQTIDFAADVVELRRILTKNVRLALRTEILDENMWLRMHAFVATGGGAQLLDLDAWDDDRTPAQLNIYANVIGQWYAGQELLADTAAA